MLTSRWRRNDILNDLVKVFKSLYLLNPWMDLVDTLPDVRYWSEVLCCTITTHISDLEVNSDPEVKVTDLEPLSYSFWLKFLEVYIFWSFIGSCWYFAWCQMLVWSFMLYHHNPHQWPWGPGHKLWNFKLKFLDKLLEVYIFWSFNWILLILLPDIRYWSKNLMLPHPDPLTKLEVKVTDFEIFTLKFLVKSC